MTISSPLARNQYTGAGTTGPFTYGFKIFAGTDLLVTQRDLAGFETTLRYNVDYTVAGIRNRTGGSITLTLALTAGYTLTLERVLNIVQNTDLRNQGSYYPESIEDALDYLIGVDQQQQDAIGRSVHLSETYDPAVFNLQLPAPSPGKALVWNVAGLGLDNATLTAAQLSAWNAAQNMKLDTYTSAHGDFIAGTTTVLALSAAPGNVTNIVVLRRTSGTDAIYLTDEYSINGTTLTFTAPIPTGTTRVEVKYLFTYQVNTVAAANIIGLVDATQVGFTNPATGGVSTSLQARLVQKIMATDFGVVSGGSVDQATKVNAAFTAAALNNALVDFGQLVVCIKSAVTVRGAGFTFDAVSYGNASDPGFVVSAGASTGAGAAITAGLGVTTLIGTIYGSGTLPTVNLLALTNPQNVTDIRLRIYNADGYGLACTDMWDCATASVSIQNCGNDHYEAFSLTTAMAGTSNETHMGRLQVEGAKQRAIYIDPNTLCCNFDSIHSEGATITNVTAGAFVVGKAYQIATIGSTDFTAIGASANGLGLQFIATGAGSGTGTATPICWITGGAACTYTVMRLQAASLGIAWFRSSDSVWISPRLESVAAVLEGSNGLSCTLIAPSFNAAVSEYLNQTGSLVIVGGSQAAILSNWGGNASNRQFIGPNGYLEGTWTPALTFGGGATGMTYSARSAIFTKVGKLITIECNITLSAKGSSTGVAIISGLPYAAAASIAVQLGFYANLTGISSRTPVCRVDASGTTIILAWNNVDGAPGQIMDTAFANNTQLILSATYRST